MRENLNSVVPLLTGADIYTQKVTYDTNLRLYNKCQGVELALRNQITDAVESDYLSDTIFNQVNYFVNLCKLVQDPILDRCKVNLSYKIISKHNDLMNSLKTCNRRTANLKTYAHENMYAHRLQ